METKRRKLRDKFNRLIGRTVELDLRPYETLVPQVVAREPEMTAMDDAALRATADGLRERAQAEEDLDDLLVDAYALVREAARRTIGLRAFDVQVLAAVAMHRGRIAEMQTGEGKTLAAVFPAFLNSLSGRGVHVLTVNDYLARRDASWMGPAYSLLGASVGCVQQGMTPASRRQAYACDITYATANEAGFDYLRDHLAMTPEDVVHRPFHMAIVDEIDSNLIDEARIPLVVAGGEAVPGSLTQRAADVVRHLRPGVDFTTDAERRNVHLTEQGVEKVEDLLDCGNLYGSRNVALLVAVNQALHAQALVNRDVDYVVRNGAVELVDEFKGRIAENRRWPEGLHAAIEAKEGVEPTHEGMILSSITLQAFAGLYPRLTGMTGTAASGADEFKEFYGLSVAVIPTNRPSVRTDHPDHTYTHKDAKERGLLREILRVHATGRPILVGTTSVRESERIAARLRLKGVDCHVLNAKNEELEAGVIARAGMSGAVTISTNMAGRGTDIRLGGGEPKAEAHVAALGGLYVLGTNRHESVRIDYQLRGRAGRQGDPGESRFFVSLEDELVQLYGMHGPGIDADARQDEPLEDPGVNEEIERAQRMIEAQNFEIRRTLWEYGSILEQQRKAVHARRDRVLYGEEFGLLDRAVPDKAADVRERFGEDVLRLAERQITLSHIDKAWAEHLDHMAGLREGIHYVSLGRQDPLEEFRRASYEGYRTLKQRIDEGVATTFAEAEVTGAGVNLEAAGIAAPTSTWTYVINDDPAGARGSQWHNLFRGARDLIMGKE
ncbi:MAG TPA: accessory Sec system translocase SecA2 [Actinomycetota bacterium]|nr:accessory Sec system translocase SecA2 [Actinomycetota bacterium]